MNVDVVIAEIGSTTTVITAFVKVGEKKISILAQSEYYTTVDLGDVSIGLERALYNLEKKIGEKITWDKFLATSSAAGGLVITAHGLTKHMTSKVAIEAANSAGGIVKYVTSGKLQDEDLIKIKEVNPRMILITGGIDYGETNIVLFNAKKLASLELNVPFVYAGNVEIRNEIKEIFKSKGKEIIIVDNVYPNIDTLNIEPTKEVIRKLFSQNITKAPGMEKIRDIVDGEIIPTPDAVMLSAEILYELYGDLMVVDIGGATTDIDSVTEGDSELKKYAIYVEPFAKRSVEGDLGVYLNSKIVVEKMKNTLKKEFKNIDEFVENITPYPKDDRIEKFVAYLARYCYLTAIDRHVGRIEKIETHTGEKIIVRGKDLTKVRYIFGTGGILTRSVYNGWIMKSILEYIKSTSEKLLPKGDLKFMYDSYYIFAPVGLMSRIDYDSAKRLLIHTVKEVS